ncbi:hypothetical protein ACTSKR_06235 [Chitinibacteraceae bacterium HSL-7]
MTKLLFLFALTPAAHAGIFTLDSSMSGTHTSHADFTRLEDGLDALEYPNLLSVPGYLGYQAVRGELNIRGLPVIAEYATAWSTTLTFRIPALELREDFTGATRAQSRDMWIRYLRRNPELLERLLRKLVADSPVDPIAGNPNSLMSQSVMQDAELMWRGSTPGAGRHRFGLGVDVQRLDSDARGAAAALSSTRWRLPLQYAYRIGDTPDHELVVFAPLGLTDAQGSKTYDGSLGALYRYPVTSDWVLSINGAIRGTGSTDLAAGSWMYSGAMASSYTWRWQGSSITLGNLVGRYATGRATIDGTNVHPGIGNTVFRNGLMFERAIGGGGWSWQAQLVDTRFTGTELFTNWQDEVGISIGTQRAPERSKADLRAGVHYLWGDDVRAVRLDVQAWF